MWTYTKKDEQKRCPEKLQELLQQVKQASLEHTQVLKRMKLVAHNENGTK